MKKCYQATALALLITGCLNRRLLFKTNRQQKTSETITHHFFVSGIGQKKTVDGQNLWRRRAVVKTETWQTLKMDCWFITLLLLILRWKRVCIAHNNCMSCPSIWQLYLHCSLICFWVPSSCFCIVISLSLRVK